MPDQKKETKMKEQSSHSLPSPSGYYDHDTCSWRMSQGSLLQEMGEDLTLLDSLPKWGMTVDGALYELPISEHVTNGRGGFALLVTPTATEKEVGRPERYVSRGIMNDRSTRFDLTDQVAYLKTPTTGDHQKGRPERYKERAVDKINFKEKDGRIVETRFDLVDQVTYLLPTPTVQDSNNNAGRSQWERDGDPLNVAAMKLIGIKTSEELETMKQIGVNTPEQLEDGQKQ